MEAKIRHLEMIQSALNRASDNSLRIKGFAMLLLVGTLALLLRDGGSPIAIPFVFAIILILIVAFLFLLDFYFIRQSDLLTILYNRVRIQCEAKIDFSMEVDKYASELDERYKIFLPFQLVTSGIIHICIIVLLLLGMLPSYLIMPNY